jgi:hypoxanthine-guanine phosphoribosyltransferase
MLFLKTFFKKQNDFIVCSTSVDDFSTSLLLNLIRPMILEKKIVLLGDVIGEYLRRMLSELRDKEGSSVSVQICFLVNKKKYETGKIVFLA